MTMKHQIFAASILLSISVGRSAAERASNDSSTTASKWIYSWPYAKDNSCECVESKFSGLLSFDSVEDCLTSFAEEPGEYCVFEGEGLSQRSCEAAVSKQPGLLNSDCQNRCLGVVVGTMSMEDFLLSCSLELQVQWTNDISAQPDGCFSNYVYGWSDYDPHNALQHPPIKIYHDVDTAAECQELCQLVPDCVFFSWRALCDSDLSVGTFQNPEHTCLLYDEEYIEGVLSTSINSDAPLTGDTEFCDISIFKEECPLDLLAGDKFYPFLGERCLLCGCMSKCAWQSRSHITGPAFCNVGPSDECAYSRKMWTTTTTPSPTCPPNTITCPTQPVPPPETTMPELTSSTPNAVSTSTPKPGHSTTTIYVSSTTTIHVATTTTATTTAKTRTQTETTTYPDVTVSPAGTTQSKAPCPTTCVDDCDECENGDDGYDGEC